MHFDIELLSAVVGQKSHYFPSLRRQLLETTLYTKVVPGETWLAAKWSSALSIIATVKGLTSTEL